MRSPLLRSALACLLTVSLASCAARTPKEAATDPGNPLTDKPGSVVIPVDPNELAPMAKATAIPLEDALSQRFASKKLGITLRYPETIYSADCDADIPLQARELKDGVIFTTTYALDTDCKTRVSPSPTDVVDEAVRNGASATDGDVFQAIVGGWAMIHVRPAKTEADLAAFVDAVFSKKCVMGERTENGENVRIFVQARPEFTDAQTAMICGDSFTWNKTHGIALYSSLGSKNGGPEIVGRKNFLGSNGQATSVYDVEIMRSIELL